MIENVPGSTMYASGREQTTSSAGDRCGVLTGRYPANLPYFEPLPNDQAYDAACGLRLRLVTLPTP
jgi:hypothetical protein